MKNISKYSLLILFLSTSIPNRPDAEIDREKSLVMLSFMLSTILYSSIWNFVYVGPVERTIEQLEFDNHQALRQKAELEQKINALTKDNQSLKDQANNIPTQSNENMGTVSKVDKNDALQLSLSQKFKEWIRPTQSA